MRRLREQPRMTVATAGAVLCLVMIGIAIGTLAAPSDDHRARAAETRLVSATHALSARQRELRAAVARAEKADSARAHAEKELTALRRADGRLRRELRAANRVRHRRPRKP
jgi:uncharacterized membrane protein YccC